jgi:hypothetical protein
MNRFRASSDTLIETDFGSVTIGKKIAVAKTLVLILEIARVGHDNLKQKKLERRFVVVSRVLRCY